MLPVLVVVAEEKKGRCAIAHALDVVVIGEALERIPRRDAGRALETGPRRGRDRRPRQVDQLARRRLHREAARGPGWAPGVAAQCPSISPPPVVRSLGGISGAVLVWRLTTPPPPAWPPFCPGTRFQSVGWRLPGVTIVQASVSRFEANLCLFSLGPQRNGHRDSCGLLMIDSGFWIRSIRMLSGVTVPFFVTSWTRRSGIPS